MSSITANLDQILNVIKDAKIRSARKDDPVQLVAVSKYQDVSLMNALISAWPEAQTKVTFGESYVQEYASKIEHLKGEFATHLIGPLQSNKVRKAVALFNLIESVHSERVAELINKEALKTKKVMPVFLQVNISKDSNKAGFSAEELERFIDEKLSELEAIDLKGLMTITRFYQNREDVRPDFVAMRALKERLDAQFDLELSLSMGMSSDFDIAIEEGATLVRVGSALFGERS